MRAEQHQILASEAAETAWRGGGPCLRGQNIKTIKGRKTPNVRAYGGKAGDNFFSKSRFSKKLPNMGIKAKKPYESEGYSHPPALAKQ
jgi:hypothetical protein